MIQKCVVQCYRKQSPGPLKIFHSHQCAQTHWKFHRFLVLLIKAIFSSITNYRIRKMLRTTFWRRLHLNKRTLILIRKFSTDCILVKNTNKYVIHAKQATQIQNILPMPEKKNKTKLLSCYNSQNMYNQLISCKLQCLLIHITNSITWNEVLFFALILSKHTIFCCLAIAKFVIVYNVHRTYWMELSLCLKF